LIDACIATTCLAMHVNAVPTPTTAVLSWFRLALWAAAYLLLGKLAQSLALPSSNSLAAWPAAGIALACCLIEGYRAWPAILIAATIVNFLPALSHGNALLIAVGNTLAALTAAALIRRHTRIDTEFCDSRDIANFIGAAGVGCLISASFGSFAQRAANLSHVPYLEYWLGWFMSDFTGIIALTPAILSWRNNAARRWSRRQRGEFLLFALGFGLCALVILRSSPAPVLFPLLPFMLWLAFRFSQSDVAKANVLLSAIALAGALSDGGLLTMPVLGSPLMLLQLFISVTCITALALAVAVDERKRVSEHLRQMKDRLEILVEQRTAQLRATANALQSDIVAREKVQLALETKERQLEEAQRLAQLGSWHWNADTDCLTMSKEMRRIYGLAPDAPATLTYEQYLQFIPADEHILVRGVVQTTLSGAQSINYEHHVIRPDGEVRFLSCRGNVLSGSDGRPYGLLGTSQDLTEEKALERSLREAEELYRKLVELSPDAIYLLHRGRYAFSNDAGLKLLGASRIEQLRGHSVLDFIAFESRRHVAAALRQLHWLQPITALEARLVRLDMSVIDVELAATPFSEDNPQDMLLVARDISERKRSEMQIHHMAHHDSLTGLANRMLFKERLEHAIAQSYRLGKPLFVLFIDLDRFKGINDMSGHGAGDAVLRECAQRLRGCLRDTDTIARAGGDEFLILIESAAGTVDVPAIARKILASIGKPFAVDGKEFIIGASIGISTCPDDGNDVETLVKHADIAMYRAKTEGKGRFRYYSSAMAKLSLERYAMEAALRHAFERGEMALHFQPKVHLETGAMCGAEALIRWQHPQRGLLLPAEFIALAEDMGMIADIGLWTIQEVCRNCGAWRRQGLRPVRIAVNLAYSQFADEHFFDKLAQMLADFGLQPDVLEIELTETTVMQHAERLMDTLDRLKRLGVHLSIDDFGTGYSSLSYLKRLPVDSVKVDRSLIKDLPLDTDDVMITHAVLAMIHSLKLSVVAEGVETREQLQFLIENHCDAVQGFYFSPALPEPAFRAMLAAEKAFAM
jgi:diguanylate cyclase (GGDEF)-like protein/PAS domain S-box-containing protein